MYNIVIAPAMNGWIIKVGCATLVAVDKKKMLSEIDRYISKPEEVEEEYKKKALNKTCSLPLPKFTIKSVDKLDVRWK